MLVGTCPFKGTNETDLLFNIRSQSLKLPGSISVSKGSISILAKVGRFSLFSFPCPFSLRFLVVALGAHGFSTGLDRPAAAYYQKVPC
jgi:hypothetical protein